MFAQSERLIFRNCDFSNITFYGKETVMSGGINLLIENCELGNKRFYYEYLFGGGTGNTAPYSLNVHDCSFANFDFEHPFESIFTFNETSPQFLNLKGTRFVNNNAVRGGCICFAPNASYLTCRITNGIFEHNAAVFGGAIYSSSTTIDISKATFIDNSSPNGGSIYSSGLTGDLITVSNCSFVAQQTAASEISVVNTDLKVEQSLFSGSPAGGYTNIFETTKSVVFSEGNTFCGNIESFDGLSVFDLGGNSFENSCEQVDCNANGQIDSEEIDSGLELDCDLNGILDSCEVAGDPSLDCDESGTLDSCDVENGTLNDCNQNQIGDACEITANPGLDSNADGIIDSCQCITDINLDGATDFTDIVQLLSCWEQEVDGVCAFADVDKDDAIGFGDLLLVLSGFGPC